VKSSEAKIELRSQVRTTAIKNLPSKEGMKPSAGGVSRRNAPDVVGDFFIADLFETF